MSKNHVGCKHLDYEGPYNNCHIETIKPQGWKYWVRENPPYPDAPVKVQFCKLRGRINSVFECINQGEMSCFEVQEEEKLAPCPACKKPRGEEENGAYICPCPHCGDEAPF